ncbi:MAG TPA: hypothetical protein VJ044_11160 [Candidatus Hodarchaeales archaeon]|nr:hypothetical protein [Candidatus Hodarchaeales archaeon]
MRFRGGLEAIGKPMGGGMGEAVQAMGEGLLSGTITEEDLF